MMFNKTSQTCVILELYFRPLATVTYSHNMCSYLVYNVCVIITLRVFVEIKHCTYALSIIMSLIKGNLTSVNVQRKH